jgi:hypothetical protein
VTSLSNAFGFLKTKATEVATKVGDQVTTINEHVIPHLCPLVLPTPITGIRDVSGLGDHASYELTRASSASRLTSKSQRTHKH